ncbi:MAG TPA: 3-deoxy-manno-octulosonate cytidylyltransferase [Oculatellaceae cyanobacterium]
MNSAIVIPARYGSSRFPGKPLANIRGKSMLERTWTIAKSAGADEVFITTDDDRIEIAAAEFGAKVIRTRPECANGTERVFESLQVLGIEPQIVLNFQGDAVLTPSWVLSDLLAAMRADSSVQMATPATKLTFEKFDDIRKQKLAGIVGGTLVVFDKNKNALYFSKSPIPFVRTKIENAPLYRHIGLYAYRYDTLKRYLALPQSELEQLEGLEQLRALENGIPIKIVVVDYQRRTHWSVDSPEDLKKVEEIIDREGELVPDFSLSGGVNA